MLRRWCGPDRGTGDPEGDPAVSSVSGPKPRRQDCRGPWRRAQPHRRGPDSRGGSTPGRTARRRERRRGRIVGAQQCRRHERPRSVSSPESSGANTVRAPSSDCGVDIGSLLQTDEGPHVGGVVGGMADRDRLSRATRASLTVSRWVSGTITLRMAVHFWPALATISPTTASQNAPNSPCRAGRWRKDGGVE